VMIVASHVGGFLSIDTLTIYRDRSAVNASRPAQAWRRYRPELCGRPLEQQQVSYPAVYS